MKKIILSFCLFFTFVSAVSAESVDYTPNSKSAILIETATNTILFEKNADEKLAPASMTKIMSMLLIMEAIDRGDISLIDEVTISETASSMGGSQVFLQAGEVYKVEELLKGIAIASGNDAVVALAEYVSGSVSEFVNLMNRRAQELNLSNTVFKNPHGLDAEGHYSSARDMSRIASELIKHEKILEFTSIYEDYLKKNDGSSVWLVNTNKLVRFYDGVDGLKTGFTETAGYCLTATAKKNNTRFISVVMGTETSDKRSSDTTSLLNYGFNSYQTKVILKSTDSLGKKRVENGTKETVDLVLTKDYMKLLKQNEEGPNYSYNLKANRLIAPIKKGSVIGTLDVVDEKNQIVDTLEVTVLEDIPKFNLWEAFLKNLKHITAGRNIIK